MLLRRCGGTCQRWLAPPPLLLRRALSSSAGGAAESDTIFALSSAEGKAGVAVVRISGDHAERCLRELSGASELPPPRVCDLCIYDE